MQTFEQSLDDLRIALYKCYTAGSEEERLLQDVIKTTLTLVVLETRFIVTTVVEENGHTVPDMFREHILEVVNEAFDLELVKPKVN
jgi:hypothetical protein